MNIRTIIRFFCGYWNLGRLEWPSFSAVRLPIGWTMHETVLLNEADTTRTERTSARIVRVLVGLFLIVVAGLKLYGLSVSAMPRTGILASPTIQSLVIGWELLLGVWLLSGIARTLSWRAAIVTFLSFTIVSGYYGIIGQVSCGCFGAVETSPWFTTALDFSIVSVLLAQASRTDIWIWYGLAIMAACASTGWLIVGFRVSESTSQKIEVPLPFEWVGKSLPVLPTQAEHLLLEQGDWIVLYHRNDCSKCTDAVQLFKKIAGGQLNKSFLLIEVPPLAEYQNNKQNRNYLNSHLDENRDWPIPTPLWVRLSSGIVKSTNESIITKEDVELNIIP